MMLMLMFMMMMMMAPCLLSFGSYVSAFPLSSPRGRIHPPLPSLRRTDKKNPRASAGVILFLANDKNKNVVEEILDALDTMLGISPLGETDLKSSSASSTSNNEDFLERAQQRREQQLPPVDALGKPSVAIFFALLAIIPAILSIYAIQVLGVRPFGL
jgi:hypothetical protein